MIVNLATPHVAELLTALPMYTEGDWVIRECEGGTYSFEAITADKAWEVWKRTDSRMFRARRTAGGLAGPICAPQRTAQEALDCANRLWREWAEARLQTVTQELQEWQLEQSSLLEALNK